MVTIAIDTSGGNLNATLLTCPQAVIVALVREPWISVDTRREVSPRAALATRPQAATLGAIDRRAVGAIGILQYAALLFGITPHAAAVKTIGLIPVDTNGMHPDGCATD